jgi:hypothetical protein
MNFFFFFKLRVQFIALEDNQKKMWLVYALLPFPAGFDRMEAIVVNFFVSC